MKSWSAVLIVKLTPCILPFVIMLAGTSSVIIILAAAILLLLCTAGITLRRLRKKLQHTEHSLLVEMNGRLDMINNFNREVRTPLNAVIGFSEQLSHTPLQKEQQELVHNIEHAAADLMKLMNNSQDMRNLLNSDLQLSHDTFNVSQVFLSTMEAMQPLAKAKGLLFNPTFEGDNKLQVTGDVARLQQIFTHLTDNAIRYTETGSVSVYLQVSLLPGDKAIVQLEVTDTGIGISQELLPHIFEYYSYNRPYHLRPLSGAGIGLNITRQLLLLHGSDITVESSPGKGSHFSCRIVYPVAPAPQTLIITQREIEQSDGHLMEGRHVLVADDQEMNLLLISKILTRWKCTFDKAADGAIAWELFCSKQYDMVLLDVQMPRMTGMEVVQKIREQHDSQVANTPVLAITSDTTMKEKFREAGFNDCLLKPFREKDIYNTIIRHLPPVKIIT